MQTFLKYNLWAVLWGLFIIVLTILPGKVLPTIPHFWELFHPDKLVHIFIFAVFAFLQMRGFRMQPVYPLISKHAVIITMLISFFLAAGTELLQDWYIPMRFGSIYDFIANAVGCLIGWFFFHRWMKLE